MVTSLVLFYHKFEYIIRFLALVSQYSLNTTWEEITEASMRIYFDIVLVK